MAFILAIGSRQYMLAFPVAVAVYEFTATLRSALRCDSLKSATGRICHTGMRWMMPGIAALTILGWFWLINGMAPKSGIAMGGTPVVQRETWAVAVDASLYFLACLGFYFVIPEWMLFSRRVSVKVPDPRPAQLASRLSGDRAAMDGGYGL